MTTWKVTPSWKKSIIERQFWIKEGVPGYIQHEICWRWGEFIIESDDEPEIDEDTNLLNLSDSWSTEDGCSEETDYDLADPLIEEEARRIVEEGSVFDLEEHGWTMDDCEMVMQCEPVIEEIEAE